jgi:hypothetical protein
MIGGLSFQRFKDDAAKVEFVFVEVPEELPASLTLLWGVGFTATLRIGAFREIVTVVVAFARKSVCRHDLLQRFCGGHVDCARRSFSRRNQCLDDARSAPNASLVDVSVHKGFSSEHCV